MIVNKSYLQKRSGVLGFRFCLRIFRNPCVLYRMRDEEQIIELSRGIFRPAEISESKETNLTTASLRVPAGVVCLISALSVQNLTTEIPREVYPALPREKSVPKADYPPRRIFHFSNDAYAAGVESHLINGIEIKVYSSEKTVADCFKFRNRIGLSQSGFLRKFIRKPRTFRLRAGQCRRLKVLGDGRTGFNQHQNKRFLRHLAAQSEFGVSGRSVSRSD